MRTRFELADVINLFGSGLVDRTKLTPLQLRVLGKIGHCRTAALGGHQEACDNCGVVRYSYNSCGDRHCPKCQAAKQAFWVDKLMQNTLCVKHFHIVFTVPHLLNVVCLHNQRLYYDLLFAAVWQILRSFGYSHFGAETGAVAVLHTWGQNLSLHPHIHCIVPSAGYTLKGQWINIGHSGQYTHRVAITNQRILNIANGKVTFIAKDYRDNDTKKQVTLDAIEFLRRFAMHILPRRFVKIRRFGIYNHTTKQNPDLQFTQPPKVKVDAIANQPAETTLQRIERLTGFNPCLCPICKTGKMIVICKLPQIRSPAIPDCIMQQKD